MSQVYVPWPRRPTRRYSGVSALLARAAAAIYRVAAPIVRRFAGIIFSVATVATCLLCWFVGLAFATTAQVQAWHAARSGAGSVGFLSLAQVDEGGRALGTWLPTWLLWSLQSLLVRDVISLAGVIGFVSILAMFAIWWERCGRYLGAFPNAADLDYLDAVKRGDA